MPAPPDRAAAGAPSAWQAWPRSGRPGRRGGAGWAGHRADSSSRLYLPAVQVRARVGLCAGQPDTSSGSVSRVASYDDDLRFAHVLADAADDITTKRFRALDLR